MAIVRGKAWSFCHFAQESGSQGLRFIFSACSGIQSPEKLWRKTGTWVLSCPDMDAPAPVPWDRAPGNVSSSKGKLVKVIASSIRKGNILEREGGQLYVVLTAESFHPGKGTPTTQIDMRRLSDGVKTTDRYKTTEQVERAYVEDSNFSYLFQDANGCHFMNTETYDQLVVPAGVIGEQTVYLQEGMICVLSIFNGTAVGVQLPARVTLEVMETEPAMKGQTASSSYKPAKLSNGARVMVPPHISPGVRVIVQTEDGSYVERAKD
jgi:elongation factor P